MPKNLAGSQWVCSLLLLISCLSGCGGNADGPDGTQQRFKVLNATETKIDVESIVEMSDHVSLFIGEKKWGSSSYKNAAKQRMTLEATDQIKLEDGKTGYGIAFTVSCTKGDSEKQSSVGSTQYLAIVKNGTIPYGQVIFRDASSVIQTANSLTLADIKTPDGELIPISFRLE